MDAELIFYHLCNNIQTF